MKLDAQDLEHVANHVPKTLSQLKNSHLFLTGGTGFFGKWLVESWIYLNEHFDLNAQLIVLSREPAQFLARAPHLKNKSISWVTGDVLTYQNPASSFDYCIHAATPASAAMNEQHPLAMLDVTMEGTRNILNLATQARCRRFLLVSSGAVYGTQPPNMKNISETYEGGPNPLESRSAYGEGKRVSELMTCVASDSHSDFQVSIARCFAFVGPHLPLDTHFAIGNFLLNALHKEPIKIRGDGTPYRSYMYTSDLMVWLWTLLLEGPDKVAFNVGAEAPVSIAEVAGFVGKRFEIPVHVAQKADPNQLPSRYVPDTTKAQNALGLKTFIKLEESIERTFDWYERAKYVKASQGR